MRLYRFFILLLFAALCPLSVLAQKGSASKEAAQLSSAREHLRLYQFDEANQELTSLLEANPEGPKTAEIQAMLQQATVGGQLLEHVRRVAVLDTQVVSHSAMLTSIPWTGDMGSLTIQSKRMTYENARHTRRILSQDGVLFLQDKGLDEWNAPEPLGDPVAQEGVKQVFPFLMADGVTLIFAQSGPESLGELDLFRTKWNPQTRVWSQPENIGMPFCSLGNDYLLAIDEDAAEAFLVSDRDQKPGQVCIYRLLWRENPPLDDAEDDFTAYAALRKMHRGQQRAVAAVDTPESTVSADSYDLLIADGVHYHQDSDFHNAEALDAAHVYLQELAVYSQMEQLLNAKRQQYAGADAELKEQLKLEIPQLEQQLRQQKNILDLQLQQIRQLEGQQ